MTIKNVRALSCFPTLTRFRCYPVICVSDVPLGYGENKSVLPGMGLEHGLPPEQEDIAPGN